MENHSKKSEPTANSAGATYVPLVDEVLQRPEIEGPKVFEETLTEQLSAMRMEANQIAESITLLAKGANSVVRKVPTVLEEQLVRQVQENPIKFLVATVALSFGVTSTLLGRRAR